MILLRLIKRKTLKTAPAVIVLILLFVPGPVQARSTPHHIYNISRRLCETVGGPFYGVFVQGPKNIKETWQAEVWEQEKPEKRGKLQYKLFAVYRAPGEEAKGIIKGITDSVVSLGKACTELISIFFGD